MRAAGQLQFSAHRVLDVGRSGRARPAPAVEPDAHRCGWPPPSIDLGDALDDGEPVGEAPAGESVRSSCRNRSGRVIQRITAASPSTFSTSGVSASSGSRERAATRSRTSLAAASRARQAELDRHLVRSSRDCEVMNLMPSMPPTAASISSVIWVSTTAAEAPR